MEVSYSDPGEMGGYGADMIAYLIESTKLGTTSDKREFLRSTHLQLKIWMMLCLSRRLLLEGILLVYI
jgi:hypothetical protein